MAEWLKATVLKTVDGRLSVSSNLTSSAKKHKKTTQLGRFFSSVGKLAPPPIQRETEYPQPICKLVVDGNDITAAIEQRLDSIRLTDNRGMEADTLDISLSDHDGALEIPPRGAKIELWLGWSTSGLVYKGSYTVDETEHSSAPDMLNIRARSADLRETLKIKREQTWKDASLREILSTIALRSQLDLKIAPSLADEIIVHLDQANESDANIITRLAEQFDAVIGVKAGHLICSPTGAGKTSSGLSLPHITLTREDGDGHRFLQADRNSYSGVKAYYYEQNSAVKQEAIAGGGDNLKELRHTYADKQSALSAARSELSRLLRGTATLSYQLAHGRPDLIPELTIGVKDEIDAITWLGSKVTHAYSSSGYTTSLELENQLPEMDDITELADLSNDYTGVVAYYKDKDGKQQKMEKGDQTKPKRLAHLYASKASAKKAVDREQEKLSKKTDP